MRIPTHPVYAGRLFATWFVNIFPLLTGIVCMLDFEFSGRQTSSFADVQAPLYK